MKAIRTICPKCGTEEVHKEDTGNLHEYSEELIFKRCSECKKSTNPEDKLLAAIFGEGNEGSDMRRQRLDEQAKDT